MIMRYTKYLVCVLALSTMLLSCVRESVVKIEDMNVGLDSVSDGREILVKFTPEVATIIAEAGVSRSSLTRSGVMSVDEVLDAIGGMELKRVFPVDTRYEERSKRDGMDRWYIVRFGKNISEEEVCRRFKALGEVQNVDVNRTIKRANTRPARPLTKEAYERAVKATRTSSTPFEDPMFHQQWYLENNGSLSQNDDGKFLAGADVRVVEAWKNCTTGDPSIVVAVLDEGICFEHPDLAANMWINKSETIHSKVDNDKNGYVGDQYGYNFVSDSGVISWNNRYDSGHGSHVAGTIAAVNNNGKGISSIAGGDGTEGSGVRIMSCQIFSGNISTGLVNVVRAIKYAADNGAVVLQCSWGYTSGLANPLEWGSGYFTTEEEWAMYSPLEKDALDYFTHNAGSPNGVIDGGIVVYASGNESAPMAGFPGAAEDYISVAATAADFTPAVYTNYGFGTNISAPGGDQDYYYDYYDSVSKQYGLDGCILSTLPPHVSESGYGFMEGTSMATPQVSAVVALGLSYATKLRRHFKANEIKQLLYESATPIDQYMKGYKVYSRYVIDMGPIQPSGMELAPYAGKMGAGQVNAYAFLQKIADSGVDMRFPNISVKVGATTTVAPAQYFKNGENLTYTVEIADTSIAVCESDGEKLKFSGLKSGATKAAIKASDNTTHEFNITVQKYDDWL